MSINTAVVHLRPTLERVAGFAALAPNWDSYGGVPSTPRAISEATALLVVLADHPNLAGRVVPYAVAPIPDGGVQMEWRGPRHDIEVEVGPGGELGYLLITRREDRRQFDEESDVPAQQVLDLVIRVLSGEPGG